VEQARAQLVGAQANCQFAATKRSLQVCAIKGWRPTSVCGRPSMSATRRPASSARLGAEAQRQSASASS